MKQRSLFKLLALLLALDRRGHALRVWLGAELSAGLRCLPQRQGPVFGPIGVWQDRVGPRAFRALFFAVTAYALDRGLVDHLTRDISDAIDEMGVDEIAAVGECGIPTRHGNGRQIGAAQRH